MKHVKSERLKKLETELRDLEEWLKMGLVPKKDITKHQEEIEMVRQRIEEEMERLNFLRESGEGEEYVAPKRNVARSSYSDMPSIPDVDIQDSTQGGDSNYEQESSHGFESTATETQDDETAAANEDSNHEEQDTDEESYFSDRNRWKRGGIIDPDADEW